MQWVVLLGVLAGAPPAREAPFVWATSPPPPPPPEAGVAALEVFDDGTGPALYAGGFFTTAGGVPANNVAKWNGTQWAALGKGMGDTYPSVGALAVFKDGTGPALYAGGRFTTAGGVPANNVAKWNGTRWVPLTSGTSGGENNGVNALTVFDDGTGPALYAGGKFTTAGGVPANNVAKWNGTRWAALGSGLEGNEFAHVTDLAVLNEGPGRALYAAGFFTTAGGVPANNIAKWNGTPWAALGSGISGGPGPFVSALTVFDDGTGPALHAGGQFTQAGGVPAKGIAKWNGTAWTALRSGTNDNVYALAVFNDGTGPALYAGGVFRQAGAIAASRIAKWNGTRWAPLGSGIGGTEFGLVFALAGFNDGTGPALYVGGVFKQAGDILANNIAKWNGSRWAALGGGIRGRSRPR